MIPYKPFEILPKILIQTVRAPELFGGAKLLPKSWSLQQRNIDKRQTDGSCNKCIGDDTKAAASQSLNCI